VTTVASSDLLKKAYAAFNSRDIDGALTTMRSDVEWPNGMEGGFVYGHEDVRAYWTRQWGMIDPHVDPLAFEADDAGRIVVTVHQVVRDLSGRVLRDVMVEHIYSFQDALIQRMDIRK